MRNSLSAKKDQTYFLCDRVYVSIQVQVSVSICMCVCVHVCARVYVYICMSYACAWTVCTCEHVCTYMHVFRHMHVCAVCLCMHVCLYVCVGVCPACVYVGEGHSVLSSTSRGQPRWTESCSDDPYHAAACSFFLDYRSALPDPSSSFFCPPSAPA